MIDAPMILKVMARSNAASGCHSLPVDLRSSPSTINFMSPKPPSPTQFPAFNQEIPLFAICYFCP
jgi:hypothetical protein